MHKITSNTSPFKASFFSVGKEMIPSAFIKAGMSPEEDKLMGSATQQPSSYFNVTITCNVRDELFFISADSFAVIFVVV